MMTSSTDKQAISGKDFTGGQGVLEFKNKEVRNCIIFKNEDF